MLVGHYNALLRRREDMVKVNTAYSVVFRIITILLGSSQWIHRISAQLSISISVKMRDTESCTSHGYDNHSMRLILKQ